MIRKFFLLLLITGLYLALNSQPVKYRFSHIGTIEGVANNRVHNILQDSKGYMWFATENGLQRYDGFRFVNYHFEFEDNRSLPSDYVTKLLEDEKGFIWVACNTGVATINQFRQKPQRIPFDMKETDLQMEVTQLFQDSKKNIWLACRPYGVFMYDKKTQKFIEGRKFLPAFRWQIQHVAEEAGTGNYWLGCDSGLAYYDIRRKEIYNHEYNPQGFHILNNAAFCHVAVTGLFIDKRKQLWINTLKSGYPFATNLYYDNYIYDLTTSNLQTYETPVRNNHLYGSDKHGNLWIFAQGIFAERRGDRFVPVYSRNDDPYGLKAREVHSLFEDNEHNYWIGTENGVYVFNREKEKINRGLAFDRNGKPIEAEIMQFLELPNGKTWMATWGQGIFEYDDQFYPVKRYQFENDPEKVFSMVWCMYKAKDGKIWIGCQAGRIMIYDPSARIFEKLAPPAFDMRTVRTITQDQQSNIWFGTQHGLIVKYDPCSKKFIRFSENHYPQKQQYGNIQQLYIDSHNSLWVCTSGAGLFKMDVSNGRIIERYQHNKNNPSSLSGGGVASLIEYNDSIMMAASLGINVINTKTKKCQHITTVDGLPTNAVSSLQKDAAGNVWAGLSGAFVKVSWPSKKIEVYNKEDGVLNNAFQVNGMHVLNDGRIVAGTSKDFIYFDPKNLHTSEVPPDVKITGLKVFQNDINIDSMLLLEDKLRLSYEQSFVTFEFSSLTYLNDKFTYYYKLEGVDKDWTRATSNLSASYNYLHGGNYTFLVRSENGEGIRSKHISSLKMYIRPPFWETWWFYFLLAAVLTGILYYIHQNSMSRLVEMQKVRTRIARDLHDDMGSTLSTINILSEMSKMKIDRDVDITKDYLCKISDNSSRMMEAMDDIVWSINPINDNMQKITARMREYATNLFEAKDIDYTFQVDEGVRQIRLDMEARRDFFLIFKEAINNLVKYSRCKHASVKIETYEYSMIMKIQDDGVGFEVQGVDNGNGLANMHKRAQALNGILTINSRLNVGTKVILEAKFA